MHGVKPKKLLPIATAFMFSTSAFHMSIPMNTAYSAENEMSITAGSIIPDDLYSIKNVNSGKYLSQRYGNVLQLSSPKAWRIINTKLKAGSQAIFARITGLTFLICVL